MYRGQVEQVRGGHLPSRTGERPCKVARLQGETDSQQAPWHRFGLEFDRVPPVESMKNTCLAGFLGQV